MLTLTPTEAEVLANVDEDLCTLRELQDRLELRFDTPAEGTEQAALWLLDKGLIEEWRGARQPFYWPTPAGTIAIAAHRRRAKLVHFTLTSHAA